MRLFMLIEGEIKRIKIKKFFTFFSKKNFFRPARWRKFFTPAEMETNNYFILAQHLELASKPEPDLWDTVDRSRKWLVDFNPEKTEIVSFDQSNNSGNFDVKMGGSVLEKNHLSRCWNSFSLQNWIAALILPLLIKLPLRKLEPWSVLWWFISDLDLQLDLAWNTFVMSGLVLLAATEKDM